MSKNPWVAAVLSFLVTGAGQVYLGHVIKGLLLYVATALAGYSYFVLGSDVCGFLGFSVRVYSVVDAYYSAKGAGPVGKVVEEGPKQPVLRVF